MHCNYCFVQIRCCKTHHSPLGCLCSCINFQGKVFSLLLNLRKSPWKEGTSKHAIHSEDNGKQKKVKEDKCLTTSFFHPYIQTHNK